MRGKTSLLRRWLSSAVYIQRKRSERSPPPTTASAVSGHCPNDLVSLDSEFGQLVGSAHGVRNSGVLQSSAYSERSWFYVRTA